MTTSHSKKPRWLDDAWIPRNEALFPVGCTVQRNGALGDVVGYGESDHGPTLQVQFDHESSPRFFALNFPTLNEVLSVVHKAPERLPGIAHRLIVPDNRPFTVPGALGLGATVDSYTPAPRRTHRLRDCPDIAWVQRVLANATDVIDAGLDDREFRLSDEAEATRYFIRKTTDLIEVVTLQRFNGRWAWLESESIIRSDEVDVLNAEPDTFYGDNYIVGMVAGSAAVGRRWRDPLWALHATGYNPAGPTRVSLYADAHIVHAPPRRPAIDQHSDFVEFGFGSKARFRAHAQEVTTIERTGSEYWRVLTTAMQLDIDQKGELGHISIPLYCPKHAGPSWIEVGDELEGGFSWMGTLALVWGR